MIWIILLPILASALTVLGLRAMWKAPKDPFDGPEFTPEAPTVPDAIIQPKAQWERFGDTERTDWDLMMEARKLHRTHIDRAEKRKWN